VIGNTGSDLLASACEEVFHKGDFLTYEDKYKGGDGKSMGMASTKRKIPAELSADTLEAIKNTAKKVFNALNCFGLARIDFLVKENPLEIYVIEVNTIPGSMAFYLWEESGVSFKELISKLIEYSIIRSKEKSTSTTTFSSDILKDFKPGLKSPKLK
jgi:D-alanine-D-alanine ligase